MQDFLDFITGLWKDWKANVTGGALAVILTIWGIVSKNVPPRAWVFASLAAYFFISAFRLWKKERQDNRVIAAKALARELDLLTRLQQARKPEPPKFTEAQYRHVVETISPLLIEERRVLEHMARGGSHTPTTIATKFGVDKMMLNNLAARTSLIRTESPTIGRKEALVGSYRFDPDYQAAAAHYFQDQPTADSNSSNSET